MASKDKEVKKRTEALGALREASNADAEALAAAQQHFNAVSAGLSSNEDGEDATLAGQMMACKNEISKAETEAKQARFHACVSWWGQEILCHRKGSYVCFCMHFCRMSSNKGNGLTVKAHNN